MKRFHVHVAVENLTDSIHFYSNLFAVQPTVQKPDYAKWMLEDPRINFAISQRGEHPGVNHLGIQVENEDEFKEMDIRLKALQQLVTVEEGTSCCYAKSNKYWAVDPQGLAWETFHSLSEVPTYGADPKIAQASGKQSKACCIPLHEGA